MLALEQLGADPRSSVYVGDAPFDIQAAKAAGMTAFGVAWGNIHPRSRLEAEQPDAIIDHPARLADAL